MKMKSIAVVFLLVGLTSLRASSQSIDSIKNVLISGEWNFCASDPIRDFIEVEKYENSDNRYSLYKDPECEDLEFFRCNFSEDGNLYSAYSSGYSRKDVSLSGVNIADMKGDYWKGRKWSIDSRDSVLKIIYPDESVVMFKYEISEEKLTLYHVKIK